MRKLEKLKLQRDVYGLGLPQCEEHHLPLMRHEGTLRYDNGALEGCWDCPYIDENGKQCDHHIHEQWNSPWAGIDFGEEENVVQRAYRLHEEAFYAEHPEAKEFFERV